MPSSYKLLLMTSLAFGMTTCGESKTPQHSRSATDTDTAEKLNPSRVDAAPPPPPPSAEKTPVQEPLPVPQAYFGDIGLPRVEGTVSVEPKKGNSVVLAIIDAFNPKHTSLYGYALPTTPNLEKLSRKGLVLTNYISNSSWTRPSYTTIITGLPKRDHGVELNGNHVEKNIVTLAERFKKAGYRTAGIVGNPLVRAIWGFGQGFQHYVDTQTMDKAFPPDQVIVDHGIKWLKKQNDKPFFLLLFLTSPHVPYRPPAKHQNYLKALPPGDVIQYPFKEYQTPLKKLDHERIVAAYDGDVAYGDEQVGRLVKYLEDSGKMATTTVLVTADHGEVFGNHNCYVHAYHMWEPALRVPFVLVSPALPVKGKYADGPFTHIDIAPTLLHLSGLKKDPDLPGRSIAASLGTDVPSPNRPILSQYNAHGVRRQSLRKGRLKLVHHHKVDLEALKDIDKLHTKIPQPDPMKLPSLAYKEEKYELYDLADDPNEETDLYPERKDTKEVQALKENIDAMIMSKTGAPNLSEETIEALKAAGYIRGE